MASEVEVERMVARLIGDTKQYVTSFVDAGKVAEDTARRIEEATDRVKEKSITSSILMANAITALAGSIKHYGQEALNEYGQAELGELRLKTALEVNNRQVEKTMESYKKYAEQLQKNTTLEDDYVLTLFKSAEQFEVTGESAKKAVHDAVALASANNSSADSMIRLTSAMAKGDLGTGMRFARMIPQLRGVKDQTEFIAKYTKLVESGFKQAEAETQTFVGTMKQMKVAFGNALEVVGKFVAEALQPVVRWLKQASEWFQSLPENVARTITTVSLLTVGIATLIAAWGPITAIVGGALTVIGGLFTPMGVGIAAVVAGVFVLVEAMGGWEASWNKMRQTAQAFWDYVKPIVLLFADIAKDAFNSVWAVAKEVFGYIGTFVSEVWDKIGINVSIVFTKIKKVIMESMIGAGYIFTNFGKISALMWTQVILSVVKAANIIEYHFTKTIPAWLTYFGKFATSVFNAVAKSGFESMTTLGANIGDLFRLLPDLMSGEITTEEWIGMWQPISTSFNAAFVELPTIAERELGKVEKALIKNRDRLKGEVKEGYQAYRKEKLANLSAALGLDEAKDKLDGVGEAFKGVGKHAHDASKESVEFGSAEHLSRLGKYFDALRGDGIKAVEAVKKAQGSIGQETAGKFSAGLGAGQGLGNFVRFKAGQMGGEQPAERGMATVPDEVKNKLAESQQQRLSEIRNKGLKAQEDAKRRLEEIKTQMDTNAVATLAERDVKNRDIREKGKDTYGPNRDYIMDDRNYPDTRLERVEKLQEQLKELVKINKAILNKAGITISPAGL